MKRRAFFATPLLAAFDPGELPLMTMGELVTVTDGMEWDGNGFLTSVVINGQRIYAKEALDPYWEPPQDTLTVTSVDHKNGAFSVEGDHIFQKVEL